MTNPSPQASPKRLPLLVGVGGLLLVLVGGWFWLKPSEPPPPAVPTAPLVTEAPKPTTDMSKLSPALRALEQAWQARMASQADPVIGKKASFTVTQNNHRQWELLVDEALYVDNAPALTSPKTTDEGLPATPDPPEASQAYLKGIQGELFNEQGKGVAKFSAPYGQYDQAKQHLKLEGGVTVVAERAAASLGDTTPKVATTTAQANAFRVSAPQLQWQGGNPKLQASGGVVVTLGSLGQATSSTARFSLDLSEIELRGNAISTLQALR